MAGQSMGWLTYSLLAGLLVALTFLGFLVRRQRTDSVEEELRRSEDKFRLLFQNNSVGVGISRVDGQVLMVNSAMSEVVGYSQSELIKISLTDIYKDPEDRKKVLEVLGQSGKVENFEVQLKHGKGGLVWVSLSGRMIEFEGQEAFLTTILDITQKKFTEHSLQASQARYKQLFNESPVPLWEEDFCELYSYLDELRENGVEDFRDYFDSHPDEIALCSEKVQILDVNLAALELHGASSKEELYGNLHRLFTADSMRTFKEEVVAIADGKMEFETEGEVRTLAGEKRIVLLKVKLERGQDSSTTALLATVDVTEHRHAARDFLESSRRLQMLMKNLPGMAYQRTGQPDWPMSFVSEGCRPLTGYGPDELTETSGTTFGDLIHPNDKELVSGITQQAVQKREPFTKEYRIVDRADEERWVWEKGQAVCNDSGKVELVEGFIMDITHRKRAERELIKHQNDLEEAVESRTEELRELVNAMAGRENRMAELKETIEELKAQIKDAGLTPVTDGPHK